MSRQLRLGLVRRVGALPEGAADDEDALGRAVAAIGLQHHAAPAARGAHRAARGAAGQPRSGASRLGRQAGQAAVGGREGGVDLRDHRGALADRAADALDRARAHVADGEDPGQARLERRLARRRARHRGAGQHEAGAVEAQPAGPHPAASRGRRRRRGRGCGSAAVSLAPSRGAPGDALEMPRRVAARAPVTSVSAQQLDVRRRRDPVDEVARHALVEVRAADQQVHLARRGRRGRPPPGRRSCRRRPAPPRRRRRAAPRSARPSTRRRGPRSARCRGSPAGGSARRWRSPRCAP